MTSQVSDFSNGFSNQILESLNAPAMPSDMQGKIAYVNDGMLHLIGLSREQVVGQAFPYPWLLPRGPLSKVPWVKSDCDLTSVAEVESLVTDSQGTPHNINFNVTPLRESDGKPKWLLSIGRDVMSLANAGAYEPDTQALLVRAIEDMPEWVQLSSLDGTIEMINEALAAPFRGIPTGRDYRPGMALPMVLRRLA